MPNIVVDKQDMLNVIAYILSLKGRDADQRLRSLSGERRVKLVRVLLADHPATAPSMRVPRSGFRPCRAASAPSSRCCILAPRLKSACRIRPSSARSISRSWSTSAGSRSSVRDAPGAQMVQPRSRALFPRPGRASSPSKICLREAVAMRAKVSDLTIAAEHRSRQLIRSSRSRIRDAALFNSGRPDARGAERDGGRLRSASTVVIAWKDSVEAVRAVAAAEPFLAEAEARSSSISITETGRRGRERRRRWPSI